MELFLTHLAMLLYFGSLILAFSRFTSFRKKLFWWSIALCFLGVLLHLVAIVSRGLSAGYFPATNLYETFSLLAFFAVLNYVLFSLKYKRRMASLGLFVLPIALILLAVAVTQSAEITPLPEKLRSPWLYIHTTFNILATSALLAHVAMSVLYVIQERRLKIKKRIYGSGSLLSLEECDEVGLRALKVGFPLLTAGIISGAFWAAGSRGGFMVWRFPEGLAILAWIIFGIILERRLVTGWRGRAPALWSSFSFALLVFILIGVIVF